MSNVNGTAGDDDLKALSDGSRVSAGAGNDILRGNKGDDVLIGGAGDDQLWGGGGADQFRFFGDQIEGASDTDRLFDLNFGDGDWIVFGKFDGLFEDGDGINAFDNGDSAIISSWEGLANAYEASNGRITYSGSTSTDLLFISFDNGSGQTQTLRISNGYTAFQAALGDSIPV